MRGASLVGAWAILLIVLAGCTPLYVPPVPDAPEIEEPVRIARGSSLEVRNGNLVAVLDVASRTASGWLTLQWFDPGLTEVASDSVWLEAAAGPSVLQIGLPDHVVVRPGRWRLVVAYRGEVVRQLDVVVPTS